MKVLTKHPDTYNKVVKGDSLVYMYEKEKDRRISAEKECQDIKDKYDQLCGKLKTNANDKRNTEGDDFLRNYARDWK